MITNESPLEELHGSYLISDWKCDSCRIRSLCKVTRKCPYDEEELCDNCMHISGTTWCALSGIY